MDIAYVLINCDLGYEEEILDSLKHMESVKEVHGTFGAYDIITKVENQDKDKLRETITWNIRKLQHVRSTLTLMGIQGQN
jgi:DNA-binding Lrp family transcriptional regulator